MSPRDLSPNLLALYASASLWNITMGMLQVLIPLYGLALGFSILKIGTIVALPVLAEMVTRLMGSAMSDRYGEGRALQGCHLLMVFSGAALIGAESYRDLLVAQTLAYFSRSVFWTSVQSLASQLPGSSIGRRLGLLTAVNYAGGWAGLNLGGVLAALVGYRSAFMVFTAVAATGTLLTLALPPTEPKPHGRTVRQIAAGMARFLRRPRTWLTITASYAAAFPVSMTISIYPIYLAKLSYSEGWIGAAVSFRSLGAVLVALTLGTFITLDRQRRIYASGMVALGVLSVASGLTEEIFLLGILIAALGAAGVAMDLLYQVQATVWSGASDRSVAMASMGLGWNLAPLLTPLVVGWCAETLGFRQAFVITGILFILVGAGTRLWHELLLADETSGTERARSEA